MRIGIVCYASLGGSGIVATELAHALALGGHEVHLISSELPFRWRVGVPGLSFERVETPAYPLFREPQYLLALANTIARVAEERRLDLVHAHYAVPHATAAYLADEILRSTCQVPPPRTVTTLHGTDITLLGSDASYRRVVAFSVERSDGLTAVSESLKRDTIQALNIRRDIRVIPNFLDCGEFRRRVDPSFREWACPSGRFDALVVHLSNFRPVKRVGVVLEVFRRIRERVRARLVMIGDGPDRAGLERQIDREGLREAVEFVGERQDAVQWLSAADLLLLPSIQESFGLAALEAMACEVPVVASRVGGLPEVIDHGVTGFLCEPDDLDGMVATSVGLLTDASLRSRIGGAAAGKVRRQFCTSIIVPKYEGYYQEVLSSPPAQVTTEAIGRRRAADDT
jgi:N-acetyl-alpha-D-glucosaminyl L-malate synthase BshA